MTLEATFLDPPELGTCINPLFHNNAFDAFEVSRIWKYYGKWSICSFGINLIFPKYFQKYSKLNLNFSWIFSMLSKIEN